MNRICIIALFLMIWASLFTCVSARAQTTKSQPALFQVVDDVCDKNVVLLGELPSHGEAKTFQAKATIVKELVLRCGFDAVLFEAPVYEFIGLQRSAANNGASPEQLGQAMGSFWTTRELKSWRNWLFSEFNTGRLYLGGIDDQVSATSHFARATLPGLVGSFSSSDRAETCSQSIDRNLFWRYDSENAYDSDEMEALALCAQAAATVVAVRPEKDMDRLMVQNLASLYARQQGEPMAPTRDEAMYRNVLWHKDLLGDDSKIIVWTATVHAARQQGSLRDKPVGMWLSEALGTTATSIGFSAFSGQSSMAGMPIRPLAETAPGSLEAIASKSNTSWVYLDHASLREIGSVSSRLLGKTTTADWSLFFDGVLIIRKEVAPTFEPK